MILLNEKEIYAITEVCYIIDNLSYEDRNKIPSNIYKTFLKYKDDKIYSKLHITNNNIEQISCDAKILLRLIYMYLEK